MKTVYLATSLSSFQAYLLKDILSHEGIESFFQNEAISSVYNPGIQMEVLVFEEDYEKAKEIYERGFPDYNEEDIVEE